MQIIEASACNWQLTNPGGNVISSAQPTRIPTIQHPTTIGSAANPDATLTSVGDGVINVSAKGARGRRQLKLLPIGAGAATNTMLMYVLAWNPTTTGGDGGPDQGTPAKTLWIPVQLGVFTCTLGTATGVAGSDVPATNFFAGTITATGNASDFLNVIISPAGNPIGMIVVETWGYRYMEVNFNKNASSTSNNCLWALL